MKTCCNSKSLWIITIFIAWFFEPNCANTTKTKNTTGRQNVVIPPNCILLTQKIYDQHYLWSVKLLLTIVNLYQHANNQFILSVHSSNTVNFDHAHIKNFQSPFNSHEFVLACKKSVNSICSLFRYNQF